MEAFFILVNDLLVVIVDDASLCVLRDFDVCKIRRPFYILLQSRDHVYNALEVRLFQAKDYLRQERDLLCHHVLAVLRHLRHHHHHRHRHHRHRHHRHRHHHHHHYQHPLLLVEHKVRRRSLNFSLFVIVSSAALEFDQPISFR